MPKDAKRAEDTLAQSILNAQNSIDVAMFMITNRRLANVLKSEPR